MVLDQSKCAVFRNATSVSVCAIFDVTKSIIFVSDVCGFMKLLLNLDYLEFLSS